MFKMNLFLMLILLLGTNRLMAQQTFKVVEQTATMSQGSHTCLSLELMGSDTKIILKSWAKFAKNFKGKTKFDKSTNETFTDNATIKEISDNTVDMYAVVSGAEGKGKIMVWFNLGVTYLNSQDHAERYAAAEKIMVDFGYYVSTDLIAAQLKLKAKELKMEQKELKKIEKVRLGYEKKIENLKKVIAKAETGIKTNEDEIVKNNEFENKQLAEIEATNKEIEDYNQLLKEAKERSKRR